MLTILIVDVVVVLTLLYLALNKGVENALPFFTFVLIVVPGTSQLTIPGLFGLTTQRLAIIVLGVLYFALGKRQKVTNGSTTLEVLMVVSILWSLVSTADSIVFTTSLKSMFSQLLDYFLVYYLISRCVANMKSVHKVISAVIGAMIFCGVLGWIELHYSWSVNDLFPAVSHRFGEGGMTIDEARGLRIQASFPHAILYGAAIALTIPLTFYMLAVAERTSQRIYLWLGLMLMFYNVYKTQSRGPWLGVVLGLIPLLFFAQKKIRNYVLIIALITISVLIIRPGVWDTVHNMYIATFDPDSAVGGSYQYRYDLTRAANQRLASEPSRALVGFGPDSFFWAGLYGLDSTTGLQFHFESCDSAYVELMMDTGYVGLTITVALLLFGALLCFRSARKLAKPDNLLGVILFINIVQFLFMMTSVMMYGWGQQSYFLWLSMALAVTYPRFVREERDAKRLILDPKPLEAEVAI